jgi:adenylate cyclase
VNAGLAKVRSALVPGLVVGVLAAAAAWQRGAIEPAERVLWERRAARAARAQPASPGVVLVAIDDETLRLAGGVYPIPRGALAAVLEEARAAGARVLALDLVLEDPLEGSLADENAALAGALAGGDVVLAAALRPEGGGPPSPEPSRWGAWLGSYDGEAAAEDAALARADRGRWPVVVPAGGRADLWLVPFASREEAAAAGRERGPGPRLLDPADLARGDARSRALRRRAAADVAGPTLPGRFVLRPPLPRFAVAAAALGGVSQEQEGDGRVLALRHVYPTAEGPVLSLPLAAAWLARGRPAIRVEDGALRVGDVAAPLAPDGRVLVRWLGPHDGREPFDTVHPLVSAADLLRAALAREGEEAPPAAAALAPLRGAVAVVCVTVTAGKDKRPTPVNAAAVGGEIVATAVDGFLRGAFAERAPPAVDAAAAFGLALLAAATVGTAAAAGALPAAALALGAAGVLAAILGWGAAAQALAARGTWIAVAAPAGGAIAATLAAALRLFAAERRDRRFVHDALGRYTSPALVRALLERRELLDRFGGARQELTVYFSDIRGFTTFSEGLDPERLVEFLNEYFSEQAEIVERHGGFVDKFIGDAVMAVWGAPLPAPDHAARACRAALEMRAAVAARRPRWLDRYGIEIHARAGVNTCLAVAGNVGSRQKANYTVFGDGVNLASRLEGANKAYGTEVLAGDRTREAAGPDLVFRSVDLLRVKGKREGVAVHELVARAGDLTGADRAFLATWEEAVAAWRARRIADARDRFDALAAARPDDAVARLWAGRCAAHLAAPPAADWDGIFELHDK